MNINAIVAGLFAVIALIVVAAAGFALAMMDDALHLFCLPVVGLVALALLARVLHDGVNIFKDIIDWWTNRQMALDVHRVTMEKATLDIALVQPDMAGLLPVARHQLASGALTPQVLLLLAQHVANGQPVQSVPHSLNYSPHYARIEEVKGDIVNPAMLSSEATFGDVPNFSDLFDDGVIKPGEFILGYTQDGAPKHGTLKDVYSNLIIAKSGAGKTTLQRFLLAQAAMGGAQIWVADPHGMTEDGMVNALKPLEKHFACKPAIEDEDIAGIVAAFCAMGEARIKGRDKSRTVQILAVDELNVIALDNEEGPAIVASMIKAARALRKVDMYVFASCQSALAADLGGTSGIRGSFVARYVLRSDKDLVQKLISNKRLLDMVPTLEKGRSIFVPTGGEAIPLAIPNTTVDDLRWCFDKDDAIGIAEDDEDAELENEDDESGENEELEGISGVQVVEPLNLHLKPTSNPLTRIGTDRAKNKLALSSKQQHAMILFKSGKSKTKIIAEVWETKGGPPFQAASAEFDEALRSLLSSV